MGRPSKDAEDRRKACNDDTLTTHMLVLSSYVKTKISTGLAYSSSKKQVLALTETHLPVQESCPSTERNEVVNQNFVWRSSHMSTA